MKNGIKCTHLATGYPVEIPLTPTEMELATDPTDPDGSWNIMCLLVMKRTGTEIIGQMELDNIVIDDQEFPLH